MAAKGDWVVEERGLERSNTAVRISIDGGGGSLKVLASIFDKNEDSEVIFHSERRARVPPNRCKLCCFVSLCRGFAGDLAQSKDCIGTFAA